jgi:hypothetical protein
MCLLACLEESNSRADGIAWHNRVAVTQVDAAPLIWSSSVGTAYGIADAVYTPGAANAGTDWTFRIYANVQWEDGPHSGQELTIAGFSANGHEWLGYDPMDVGYATPVFASTGVSTDFDGAHIGWFKVVKPAGGDWDAFYWAETARRIPSWTAWGTPRRRTDLPGSGPVPSRRPRTASDGAT